MVFPWLHQDSFPTGTSYPMAFPPGIGPTSAHDICSSFYSTSQHPIPCYRSTVPGVIRPPCPDPRECACSCSVLPPTGSSCFIPPPYRIEEVGRGLDVLPEHTGGITRETNRVSSIASLRLRAKEHQMNLVQILSRKWKSFTRHRLINKDEAICKLNDKQQIYMQNLAIQGIIYFSIRIYYSEDQIHCKYFLWNWNVNSFVNWEDALSLVRSFCSVTTRNCVA